jgi:hypothetical protein
MSSPVLWFVPRHLSSLDEFEAALLLGEISVLDVAQRPG